MGNDGVGVDVWRREGCVHTHDAVPQHPAEVVRGRGHEGAGGRQRADASA